MPVGSAHGFTLDLPLITKVATGWDPVNDVPTEWEERLTQHYQIDATFEFLPPPPPDPCQDEVDRVDQAQSAVTNTESLIRSLQAELRDATPSQKPHITAEIREQQRRIPQLEATLSNARRALRACRSEPRPMPPPSRPRPFPRDPVPSPPRQPPPPRDPRDR